MHKSAVTIHVCVAAGVGVEVDIRRWLTLRGWRAARAQDDESGRFIVEVRDVGDQASFCPGELILHDRPAGRVRGNLYPAAMLDEGEYVLRLNGASWPVRLRRSESQQPPAMVVEGDVDAAPTA